LGVGDALLASASRSALACRLGAVAALWLAYQWRSFLQSAHHLLIFAR
jgi:hypothetical protein